MKLAFSVLMSLCTLLSFAQVKNETRSISDYSKIDLTGRCEVIYENKPNERPFLRIEAGDDFIKNITVSCNSGTLSIKSNIGNSGVNFYNEEANIKIYTNSKRLEEVSLSGNSKMTLRGDMDLAKLKLSIFGSSLLVTEKEVKGSSIKLYVKGNGMLKADNLTATEIEFYVGGSGKADVEKITASRFSTSISGSGSVDVNGGAANLTNFRVKGNGVIKALNVKSENSDNGINGSGKIYANSSGYLKGRINGSGYVYYSGEPKDVERKIMGAGKVMPADLPK